MNEIDQLTRFRDTVPLAVTPSAEHCSSPRCGKSIIQNDRWFHVPVTRWPGSGRHGGSVSLCPRSPPSWRG